MTKQLSSFFCASWVRFYVLIVNKSSLWVQSLLTHTITCI